MALKHESYYFGCQDDSGHYLWHPKRYTSTREIGKTLPWCKADGWKIDAGLCPEDNERQGRAKLHHKDDWTAIAFWDRSVDSRPGSNSVFVIHGTHDFETMVELARVAFPQVWERFGFKVVLV